MVWVKICGITNLEDAEEISKLKVDAMGFILSTDSPRRIKAAEAGKIIKILRSRKKKISAVGVFVNEEVGKVIEDSESLGLDFIQLSGDEDGYYLKDLMERTGNINIIKSIRVNHKDKLYVKKVYEKISKLEKFVDFILMDSYRKDVYGGTGKSFRWDIIKNYCGRVPVILSGGLDAENVGEAVRTVKPFGVDASSKLEAYPGKKDIYKVSRFINVLKQPVEILRKNEKR